MNSGTLVPDSGDAAADEADGHLQRILPSIDSVVAAKLSPDDVLLVDTVRDLPPPTPKSSAATSQQSSPFLRSRKRKMMHDDQPAQRSTSSSPTSHANSLPGSEGDALFNSPIPLSEEQLEQQHRLATLLGSFVILDEEPIDPLKLDELAGFDAHVQHRTWLLRMGGSRSKPSSSSNRSNQHQLPPHESQDIHLRHMHQEMQKLSDWRSSQYRTKISNAKKVAKAIQRYWELKRTEGERFAKAEERRLKKLARIISGEIMRKWKVIDAVIRAKQKELYRQQQEAAGKRQLKAILTQSTQLLSHVASLQVETLSDEEEGMDTGDYDGAIDDENENDNDDDGDDDDDSEVEDIDELDDDDNDDEEEEDLQHLLGYDILPSNSVEQEPESRGEMISSSDAQLDNESLASPEPRPQVNNDNQEIEGSETVGQQVEDDVDMVDSFDSEEQDDSFDSESETDSELEHLQKESEYPLQEVLSASMTNGVAKCSSTVSSAPDGADVTLEHAQEKITETMDSTEDSSSKANINDTTSKIEGREAVELPTGTTLTTADVKVAVPFLLRHKLREYQHVGLDWLAKLWNNGLNGILADEMGLGKTIQTIALIAYLAVEKGIWGPHLIVVPTSVMLNWEHEFKKWCPGLKVMCYFGTQQQRRDKRKGWYKPNLFHVCITSYQLVLSDQAVLKRRAWHYLILDEAHNIKNFRSQRWQTLLTFNSQRRLLLTGTPLQNNLMELWSLLYFLMPNGISNAMPAGFASLKDFQDWFSKPVDQMIDKGRNSLTMEISDEVKGSIQQLHTILRPYLLRRLKSDVEKQMPGKFEHVVYCRLSIRQRYLYDEFMSRAKTKADLASGNYMSIINCLMQLRKVCNHPDLFESRPIVTSFAMTTAIYVSYDSKFRLIEKLLGIDKLLSGWSPITSSVSNLQVVDPNVESFTLSFWQSLHRLDPDRKFDDTVKRCAQFEMALRTQFSQILSARAGSSTNSHHMPSPNYASISEHASLLRLRHASHATLRWFRIRQLNHARCSRSALYGSSFLRLLQSFGNRDYESQHPIDKPSQKVQDLLRPSISRQVETVFGPLIDRFGFVTPRVRALGPVPGRWSPAVSVSDTTEILETLTASEQFEDVLHLASNRLTIAFPDRWLLQYDCGKLQTLDTLLRKLKAGGHRALIFTQMTRMLDILEQFLNIHGHIYLRLDGATKVEQRKVLMDRFNNNPKILVFILSTRSGGVGMNLTGADSVIFYDSDWNPAMDAQAQDRAHRIGQTRDVHIYRLISEHTIEENMLRKANEKRRLDSIVIQEGQFTTDHLKRVDWRDWLDDGMTKLVGDADKAKAGAVSWDDALVAVEDESDVNALKEARKEMDMEMVEFDDNPGDNVEEARTNNVDNTQVEMDLDDSNAGGGGMVIRHVDEFMLRHWVWELNLPADFIGLLDELVAAPAIRLPEKAHSALE